MKTARSTPGPFYIDKWIMKVPADIAQGSEQVVGKYDCSLHIGPVMILLDLIIVVTAGSPIKVDVRIARKVQSGCIKDCTRTKRIPFLAANLKLRPIETGVSK